MKKNLLFTISVSLLSVGSMASADFTASGTDYSKALAAQEQWTEDMANEFVSMPNSFACIIANSGGETNANATWTALIDEVACGLNDPDPNSSATVYSKSAMKSSRANNNSAQEVTAWFNAQGGARYIADVTLKQSSETLAPFGEWYFSFYQAGIQNPGTGAWTSYTKADANDYGYVDIGPSGDDISILVATEGVIDGAREGQADRFLHGDIYAKVLFVGGSADNTKFLGKTVNEAFKKTDGSQIGTTANAFVAGATNATHYFRQNLDASGNLVGGTAACFDRRSKFQTAHQSALYDVTTGKKVNMSGGFGFAKADGTRGYLGSWGVWIDGGETNFTLSSNSIAIKNDDGVDYNIKWAPGKMNQSSYTEQTLADGDTFKTGYNGADAIATWDNTNSKFVVKNSGGDTLANWTGNQGNKYMYSEVKRADAVWVNGTTYKMRKNKDITFSSTITGVASTKFYSRQSNGMPHTKASSLPYTLSAYNAASNDLWQDLYWDNDTDNAAKTYFLTGASPGTGLESHTLYLDNGDDALTTADSAIRFDFALNEKQNKVTNYADGTTAAIEFNNNKWPSESLQLILASEADTTGDTCDKAANDYSGCTDYEWRFGAFPWDQSTAAYDSAGALVTLDDPITIEYTYVASDDRNAGKTISQLVTEPGNHPLKGCTANGDGKDVCSNVKPADYVGEKFLLEYDGMEVQGFPGLDICAKADCTGMQYWIRLVNLKDGTQLTDSKGNKYAFLANGVSTMFEDAAGGVGDCSAISFTGLGSGAGKLGIAASDIPGVINRSSTDYPLPSSAWTDEPTTSSCTVTMGDTSNC